MDIHVVGIDLGKNSCSLAAFDGTGRVVLRRRFRRDTLMKFVEGLPKCIVAMEACCGAHHIGRRLREHGHEVRLMSPEYVRPYVKSQKNDDGDAEAIAEAATRPTMRFVEIKSEAQLDMQSLHRARERLVGERTTLINQLRALFLERGLITPQGRKAFGVWMRDVFGERAECLSARIRLLIDDMLQQWRALDVRLDAFEKEFEAQVRTDPATKRLATIPGIGMLNATALVAAVGDGRSFAKGRDLAAWLGLVPRQATTGGRPRLLGISKRGNRYLRTILIHGARAVMLRLAQTSSPLGRWLKDLMQRAHRNTVAVALANKLARIVWAVLTTGRPYRDEDLAAA